MKKSSAERNSSAFQSSPVPKDGCNDQAARTIRGLRMFQSSPVPKDGCNCAVEELIPAPRVSILTRPEGRVQQFDLGPAVAHLMFQSSPVPKDGCNSAASEQCKQACPVSILTRPEGRVQHLPVHSCTPGWHGFNPHPSRRTGATYRAMKTLERQLVSILTRPEGRVQPLSAGACTTAERVSILTRPEGRVQPNPGPVWGRENRFQSSPVPKDGCNLQGG